MLVYDVGLNDGDDSEYYLSKGCRVIGIDAHPGLCRMCEQRFKIEIEQERMTVLNLGVGNEPGVLPFYLNRTEPPISTFKPEKFLDKDWAPQDWSEVLIPVRRLSDLIKIYGMPDFLKIDVEFSDSIVLLDLLENNLHPSLISVEVQELETFDLLTEMGYKEFKVVPGEEVPERFASVEITCVDGTRKPHRFTRSNSGPFGADLTGEWVDQNEARRELSRRGVGWIDVHARI